MSEYIYDPTIGAERIRILTLERNEQWDAVIKCKLTTTTRKECEKYEALSYWWGGQEPKSFNKIIEINGLVLKIGNELESALRRLRRVDAERHLWTDAVCINQADLEEKKKQVLCMDRIYKEAKEVIIWLGEGNMDVKKAGVTIFSMTEDQTATAMNAISALGSQFQGETVKSIRNATLKLPQLDGNVGPEVYLPALRLLSQRPWFNRVWVIQEVVLARADSVTIMCAEHHAPFWQLANILWALLEPAKWHLNMDEIRAFLFNYNLLLTQAKGPPLALTRQYFAAEDWVVGGPEKARKTREENCTLLSHLWNFRDRDCSEPRDRVYALLGVSCDRWTQPIIPDYDISISETYATAVLTIVSTYRSLAVLGMSLRSLGVDDNQAMRPTWAPDFRVNKSIDPWRPVGSLTTYSGPDPYFRASNGVGAKEPRVDDLSELDVEGHEIGMIDATSFDLSKKPLTAFHRAWSLVESLENQSPRRYKDLEDAFWRTLITNRTSTNREPQDEREGQQFRNWWNVVRNSLDDATNKPAFDAVYQTDFFKAFVNNGANRGFCRTDSGFILFGPAATKVGDRIFLLAGAQVPFVLREDKVKRDGQDERVKYQVIGEAYVHGAMKGEVWMELEKSPGRKEFVLV